MTTTIIIAVLVIVAGAFLYEALRKDKTPPRLYEDFDGIPLQTANEAPPTETGAYRVREVLRKSQSKGSAVSPPEASEDKGDQEADAEPPSEDDTPLPDPFERED